MNLGPDFYETDYQAILEDCLADLHLNENRVSIPCSNTRFRSVHNEIEMSCWISQILDGGIKWKKIWSL